MNVALSIYIPSYNKAHILKRQIDSLLSCKDNRFNIIVVDDCSDDDSWNVLLGYDDARLKIFKNDKNLGPIGTWCRAISLCDGNWIVHLNDRDEINVHILPKYIDYLQKIGNDVGFVFPDAVEKDEFYEKGQVAYNSFAYYICHPTGITMNKRVLEGIEWKRYFDYEDYGMYPHGYILADVTDRWSVIRSSYRLWRESCSTFKSNKNFWSSNVYADQKKGKIYSDLPCVEHNLKRNINHILTESNNRHKILSIYIVYLKNLRATTFGYTKDISNPDRAHHYGLKSYTPNSVEIIKRVKELRHFTISILKENYMRAIPCIIIADISWVFIKLLGVSRWQSINGL